MTSTLPEAGRRAEGCTAQRRHKGGRVFVTITTILVGHCGPPCGFVGKRGGGRLDAGKSGFSHPDCTVFNGECAPADGTGTEKEADFEVESFFEIHGRGQQKLCFFSTKNLLNRLPLQ